MMKKKIHRRVKANSCTLIQNNIHNATMVNTEGVVEVADIMAEEEDAVGRIGTVETRQRSYVIDVIK